MPEVGQLHICSDIGEFILALTPFPRLRSVIAPVCAEKGLAATRPATKQKALEALLLFSEMDHPDPVVEDMLPFLNQKAPKNIAAVLTALREVCHAFGCKVVNPRPVVKALPKVFGHADKNVRAEAQALAAEVYRWVGEGMKVEFWGDLKPVQQQELEKLFEQAKSEPAPQPTRTLLSQQQNPTQEETGEGGDDEEDEVIFLPDAVDVLPMLPANLFDDLASTKWKERKEALEALQDVLNKPRIAEGQFEDLVRALAKTPKDINVAVVTAGAACIQNLALGLGTSFAKHRSTVLGPLLDRLKEKKATTLEALGGALDAVFTASGLGDCLGEIVEFLQHKVPGVRAETAKFLVRCLKTSKAAPSLAETKTIADAAIKLLGDSQEVQRNAAAEILGTLSKIMGERVMIPYLETIDELRKSKIKDYHDAAEVRAKFKPKAAPKAAPPPAAKKTAPMAKRPPPKKAAPPAASSAPPPPSTTAPASASSGVPQLSATPVAPRLTRPGLAKPGAKPGLAIPGTLKKPALGPPKSATGPTPVLTSPRRPEPDEAVASTMAPVSKLGLRGGLASRPLSRPAAASAADSFPEPTGPVIVTLNSAERAELDELRAETERLRRQNDELRAERTRLLSESAELRLLNKELGESHTCELKARDVQLRRARSDHAAAEQAAESSAREIERLKRELSRAIRSASPTVADYSDPLRRSIGLGNGPPAYTSDYVSDPVGSRYGGDVKENHRLSATSGYAVQKSSSGHSSGIPTATSMSPVYDDSPPTPSRQLQGSSSHQQYFSPPRQTGSSLRAPEIPPMSNGVESWKRAAEVTKNLKARIELMKVSTSSFFFFKLIAQAD